MLVGENVVVLGSLHVWEHDWSLDEPAWVGDSQSGQKV